MVWMLIALAAGGLTVGGRRWQRRRSAVRNRRTELDGVRRLAEEDVTVLGEQLRRLEAEIAGRDLDEAARSDHQSALDAYEHAGRAAPAIRTADELSRVVDTVSTGRYALACVQARVAGRPVPERRDPCFFDPQHGPSLADVLWTPGGGRGGSRRVPACAQDAARVAAREEPKIRTVTIRSRRVPYWEAGAAYRPYGAGYFTSGAVMGWAFADLGPGATLGGEGGGVRWGGGYSGASLGGIDNGSVDGAGTGAGDF